MSIATPQKVQTDSSPEKNVSGFFIYIGPTIHRLIQNGTIYRGTRGEAKQAAEKAIAEFPLIQTLIVAGDRLPEARLKLKQTGTALAINYRKVADAAKEKAAKRTEQEAR